MKQDKAITDRLNQLVGVTKPTKKNEFKAWRNMTNEERLIHCKQRIEWGYSLSSTEATFSKANGLLKTTNK